MKLSLISMILWFHSLFKFSINDCNKVSSIIFRILWDWIFFLFCNIFYINNELLLLLLSSSLSSSINCNQFHFLWHLGVPSEFRRKSNISLESMSRFYSCRYENIISSSKINIFNFVITWFLRLNSCSRWMCFCKCKYIIKIYI